MKINAIYADHVDLSLDANELVWLHNMIHFYEKHNDANTGFAMPDDIFHLMAKQIETAKCLFQYGRIDSRSLSKLIHHELEAYPEGYLAKKLQALLEQNAPDPDPEIEGKE